MLIPTFFARRLLLVLCLTPSLGLIAYVLQSVACIIMLCYYLTVKPWNDNYQFKLELFNEMFLLFGFTYFTHLFSPFISESWIRFNVGWYFVGILGLFIAINMIIVVIAIVMETIDKLKRRSVKKKHDAYLAKKLIEQKELEARIEKFNALPLEEK